MKSKIWVWVKYKMFYKSSKMPSSWPADIRICPHRSLCDVRISNLWLNYFPFVFLFHFFCCELKVKLLFSLINEKEEFCLKIDDIFFSASLSQAILFVFVRNSKWTGSSNMISSLSKAEKFDLAFVKQLLGMTRAPLNCFSKRHVTIVTPPYHS